MGQAYICLILTPTTFLFSLSSRASYTLYSISYIEHGNQKKVTDHSIFLNARKWLDHEFVARNFLSVLIILFLLSQFVLFKSMVSLVQLYKSNAIELSIHVEPDESTVFQAFFDLGNGFNAFNSRDIRVKGGVENLVQFSFPASTKRIRLDPANLPTEVILRDLNISRGKKSGGALDIGQCLETRNQVTMRTSESHGVNISTTGRDPQLLIPDRCITNVKITTKDFVPNFVSIAVVLIILLPVFKISRYSQLRLVSFLLYATVGLVVFQVLIVVLLSKYNLHPDEFSHVATSLFYQDHWFKLPYDHPAMLETLIPQWGSSYLFLNDITYWLAEKSTAFLSILDIETIVRYRLFNYALLIILLLIYLPDRRNGIYFLLAIGLTSQTWYLFSYLNGDALSMFFSLLLGYVYISKRSEIESFFWEGNRVSAAILMFYTLSVLVFFTRLHYAIFVFFLLGLILLVEIPNRDFRTLLKGSKRLLIFFILLTLPVAMAELKDQIVNDFEKQSRTGTIVQDHKRPEFKLEYIIETGKNPHLKQLKNTGTPYTDLFTKFGWQKKSFVSFFGVYGYVNIFAPKLIYLLSSLVGMGLTLLYLLKCAIRSNLRYRIASAFFFFSTFLVLIQSSIHSWTHAFQPQGRYLLAIIPMLAVTLALRSSTPKQRSTSIKLYIILIYLINASAFAFYGVFPMMDI